jgi:hypothetical protein
VDCSISSLNAQINPDLAIRGIANTAQVVVKVLNRVPQLPQPGRLPAKLLGNASDLRSKVMSANHFAAFDGVLGGNDAELNINQIMSTLLL